MVVICHKKFFQKRVTKIFFFFCDPFLLSKKRVKKTMTEMPEIASDGLKTKFGHKEFDLRTENDMVWTFRGEKQG